MSERPEFEESDNDATKAAKVKAWLEGVRDDLRPQVNALSEACSEQARQLAADMGEAATDANRIYWGTMGNCWYSAGANSTRDRPSFMRCTISPGACRGARPANGPWPSAAARSCSISLTVARRLGWVCGRDTLLQRQVTRLRRPGTRGRCYADRCRVLSSAFVVYARRG
jgi:hypothetical protein